MHKKKVKFFLMSLGVLVFAIVLMSFSPSFAEEQAKPETPAMTHDMSGMQHDMPNMQQGQGTTQGAAQGTETKKEAPAMGHEMGGMDHSKHMGHSWEDMKKWPGMENKTKEQLDAMMMGMPPDKEVYISNKDLKKGVGVIVIAHGGSKVWNQEVEKSLSNISKTFPTTIAFGMAMGNSKHIQEGINHLEEAGAKTIIVVMAFFNENNEVSDQVRYIFGKSDKAMWPPVDRVKSNAKIVFASYIDDNPLLAEILTDEAKKKSIDPKNETVIIVGHGPVNPEYNKKALKVMESLAKEVKASGGFRDVKAWNLQDDAPKEVRSANVKIIRGMIEEVSKNGGTALVVGMLISSRGIQHKIKEDFKGLDYKFYEEGVVTHENFGRWVGEAVTQAISK